MKVGKLKVVRGITSCFEACVATIGNFDGLHVGHRFIIDKVVKTATDKKLIPTLITFEPLPSRIFNKQASFLRLSSVRQKITLLEKWGIQQIIFLRFNLKFAQILPEVFMQQYLAAAFKVSHLIVGEDFRFGYQQQGNIATLQQGASYLHFVLETIPLKQNKTKKISSSAIRDALLQGDIATVNRFLGRPFSIEGRVIRGAQRGRELGFPTANLRLKKERCLKGVFVVKVQMDNKIHEGVMNIGTRPTVDGKNYLAEVHLFDFDDNLYGKYIKIDCLHKLRDEQQFTDLMHLSKQIVRDIQKAKEFLRENRLNRIKI